MTMFEITLQIPRGNETEKVFAPRPFGYRACVCFLQKTYARTVSEWARREHFLSFITAGNLQGYLKHCHRAPWDMHQALVTLSRDTKSTSISVMFGPMAGRARH